MLRGHGCRLAACLRRHFCAASAEAGDGAAVRLQLLDASLAHVLPLGWTDDTLSAGARDLGLSAAAVGLFPRGPAELVEHYSAGCDRRLAIELAALREELASLPVRVRIAAALRSRLAMNAEHASSWAQALSLQTHPLSALPALRMRAAMVDEVWSSVGDTSSDLDWYAKRAVLLAVYSTSEVFMLTDTSPAFASTYAYMERLLEDSWEGGKRAVEAQELLQTLARRSGPTGQRPDSA